MNATDSVSIDRRVSIISAERTNTGTAQASRHVSIDYLRAGITLLVVAHHSALAYTNFARFYPDAYLASTHPVVDPQRWDLLDYAENFNDVFFMSLMFCVSGIFVWPSLRRSGAMLFVVDRARRLGIPFIVGIVFLMPLAYYASWNLTGHSVGFLAYWKQYLTIDGRPCGPLWFIWLLLLFDLLAAVGYRCFGPTIAQSERSPTKSRGPVYMAVAMFTLCAAVYLPALAAYGFGAWRAFVTGPFYFQTSRLALYFAWFVFGIFIGRSGIRRGLLARDGALARRWPTWVAVSIIAYNALEFLPAALSHWTAIRPEQRGLLEAMLWVTSCVSSCFAFLALFRGVVSKRHAWMDSMTRCAYGIYLVHYVYVLWMQRTLLDMSLPAAPKFLATFLVATAASWVTVRLLLKIPAVRDVL